MRRVTFKSAPEYRDIEAFVEYCLDDERETFTAEDLQALSYRLRRSIPKVRAELESYGLTLQARAPARYVRGFTTSSHDRHYGPGAMRTHGGSGADQICGFGGQEG
jgi:hypothetical protein